MASASERSTSRDSTPRDYVPQGLNGYRNVSICWCFGCPQAAGELLARSDSDRQLVYEALCDRLGYGQGARRVSMRDALNACARELRVAVPSAGKYDEWRSQSPEGVGAPTS